MTITPARSCFIAFAALQALSGMAQTTCSSPPGIYPSSSNVVLNSPFKSVIPESQVDLASNSVTPLSFTVSDIQSAGGWLAVYPSFAGSFSSSAFTGSASAGRPFSITVAAQLLPSLISGQQYTGRFTVTPSSGAPITTGVTLNLGSAAALGSTLALSQNCVAFAPGVALPQTILMTGSALGWAGYISFTFDPVPYIVARGNFEPAWMQFDNGTGSEVVVEPSMTAGLLNSGTYSGRINFTGSTPAYTTLSIPVTLSVPNGLSLSPTQLRFETIGTAQQTLSITGGGSFYTGVQSSAATAPNSSASGSAWLSVSASGGTPQGGVTILQGPVNLAVKVDGSGLSAGTYNGEIDLYTGSVYRPIPVVLTVPPHGDVVVSNGSGALTGISFLLPAGASPAVQQVQVIGASRTPDSSGIAFTYSSNAAWLSVNGSQSGQASTSATLAVSATNRALELGTYQAAITVSPLGGQTVTIPVTLTVVPAIAAVTNAATFLTGPVAAGEIVSIFGEGLGPATGVPLTSELIADGQLPVSLGGVQVLISGFAAPILYAGATQISAIVPYEINAPVRVANPTVQVHYQGLVSIPMTLEQADSSPGIFTAGSSGSGQGAILNSDLSANSAQNPAHPGDTVVLYVTGEGQTNPTGITGRVTGITPPFPQPLLQPQVLIAGEPARVIFYGEAPGQVAGLMQINVEVPRTVGAGDLPVVVRVGNGASQSTPGGQGLVTLSVR